MALQKQNVPYNFTKGVDTKTDEYQIFGKLSTLENGVFQTAGAVRKRNGYEEIGLNGTVSDGNAIDAYNNELVVNTGTELYSYVKENDSFQLKGAKIAVDLAKNSVIKNNYSQSNASSAYHSSGYKFFTYLNSNAADFGYTSVSLYSIIDENTGNDIVSSQILVGNVNPISTLCLGNYFVFIYIDTASNDLYYVSVNINTPSTVSSPVLLASDLGAEINNVSNACFVNNRIYVAYGSTTYVKMFYLDTSLVKSAVSNVTVAALPSNFFTIAGDAVNNQVWVSYWNGTDIKYFVRSSTLSSVLAETTATTIADISGITIVANNGAGRLYYQVTTEYPVPSINVYSIVSATVTNTGTVGTFSTLIRDVALYSKPFLWNDDFYVVTIHESLQQSTYFLVNTDGSAVAKMIQNNGGVVTINFLSDVSLLSVNTFNVALIERDLVTSVGGVFKYDVGVVEEIMSFTKPLVSETLGNNLHVSGGLLTMYDGVNVVEHGFNLFPEDIGVVPLPYGGVLADTGAEPAAYNYSVTYDWTDNEGQLHQSAPSTPETVNTHNMIRFTGNTTSGSPIIKNVKFSTYNVMPGMTITGTNIPTGAYVTDYTANSVTISANATGTATGTSFFCNTYDVKAFTSNPETNTLNFNSTLTNGQYFYVLGTCTAGDDTMVVNDASLLKVGYILQYKNYTSANNIIGLRATMANISGFQATLTNKQDLNNLPSDYNYYAGTASAQPLVSFTTSTSGGGGVTYTQSPGATLGYIAGSGVDSTSATVSFSTTPTTINYGLPTGWSISYPYLGYQGEVPFGAPVSNVYYTISSIDGNTITVDQPFQFSATNQFIDVSFFDTGGVPTGHIGENYFRVTSFDFTDWPNSPAALQPGDTIYSTSFTPNYVTVDYITPVVGPYSWLVYFSGGVTNTGSVSFNKIFTVDHYVKPGNTISGTPLTGTATVTAVSGQFNQVYVNQNISTVSTNNMVIGNLYSVQLKIPTLRITDKIANPPVISVWRTILNGTIYNRVTSVSNPVFNNKTVDYITYYDVTDDLTLAANDDLYTTGGVVENVEIPACGILTTYRNRLIGIPFERPYTWWYSKQVIPGSPVEFNDTFIQNIDQLGGPITGIMTMDDKLIFFKQSLIYYIVGDGPTSTGINNDFSQPQLIATDSGCINKKSMVLTPVGIMYQSAKGIYLLSRSLEVKYIGADVEAYNSLTITSATLVSNFNQVRMSLSDGTTLMFDYYFTQWSVFTNYDMTDACVLGASQNASTYYFVNSAGKVCKETNGQYLDDGSYIKLKIMTNWFSLAGIQGYERFYKMLVLGHYKSPHNLTFKSYFDFDSSTTQQTTVIPVTSDPGLYQYRIFLNKQKCETVRFSLEDDGLSPLGEGFYLSAITFEVGLKAGLNKMKATASYG